MIEMTSERYDIYTLQMVFLGFVLGCFVCLSVVAFINHQNEEK